MCVAIIGGLQLICNSRLTAALSRTDRGQEKKADVAGNKCRHSSAPTCTIRLAVSIAMDPDSYSGGRDAQITL